MTRPVNLTYLSRRAGVIVLGRIANVKYEAMPGYPHIPTVLVTLQVSEMLRGPQVSVYTFRQFMPALHPRGGKYGAYVPGQESLLFLVPPSTLGLSSPIGAGQGSFIIRRDGHGRRIVVNEFGNSGLFQGVRDEALNEGLNLTPSQLQVTVRSGPVGLEDFLALTQRLTALSRIE